jgi:Lar family restriction alleviation protein
MTELRPCPFCGSKDVYFSGCDGFWTFKEYIHCLGCGVVVKVGHDGEVVERWNTRVSE